MSYKDVKIYKSEILNELVVFEPSISKDSRGNIFTSYHCNLYDKFLPDGVKFLHDKFSYSINNVLRGLHGDTKTWKLISCVWGKIYEVIVDYRPQSPNFKKWVSFNLSAENYRQILIPPGFLNGFYVLSSEAVFHYKLAYQGEYFDVPDQITVKWNDPDLKIDWPCVSPILQPRDA